MSESPKPRFAVDLNEIERHLAQAGSPQPQPAAPRSNDPLAELARIVGQDDPFQAILANDGAARPRQQPSAADDLFASRDNVTPHPRPIQARQPSYEPSNVRPGGYAQPEAPRSQAQAYAYQEPAYQEPAPARQPASYDQDAYADEYCDAGDGYGRDDYARPERLDYPSVEKPRSRRGLIAMGGVVGAIIIGGGGAYLLTSTSGGAGGEPILIQATKDPVKVQPQNPGGVEIPNQNKQIYERTQNAETKVVNREEQPVDVRQAVQSSGGSLVADATGAGMPGAAPQSRSASNSLNLGEPRKVRTVTIRPDGTVVGAPEPAQAQSAQPSVPAMTMPATAQSAAAQPKPAPATPAAAPATPAPAPNPAPAVAANPADVTPSAAAPQRVASAQSVPVAPAADATNTATGGYAVQLGLASSESAAQTAFVSYQRKYPDLEGLSSIIRKAEVNGNTIYRVRVGPMSREEASSLCSRLQGQGGQCFVAKN
ncbi:SPOR domain-containing protein [Microvirga makkahensis]|uniref:SPOR domain-containing protein n=1 Tax=Microvirga makkahensis TaxID=1128670 RepID=A0A7X3MUA2_9HYPH|nr:SPOR domain-containing protein [Microvirga makkahensis]MXQ13276.1 hypothetical protein [Microvirga makkahensis]